MLIKRIIKKLVIPKGYVVQKIDTRTNTHLTLQNWDYQKKVVLPVLPKEGIILDIGSGHNPVPVANILADFFPEDTYHRATKLVEDRPVLVCSVDRIPVLSKKIDFVICSHIFEHVNSPVRSGEELGRVAKAGYIETPAYGKDILVGTGNMHEWQAIEFEGTMHFFEYSKRQREGHVPSPMMDIWCSKQYNPWQDFFWDRMDLFNAMHLWKDKPSIIEHRRNASFPNAVTPWKPIDKDLLSKMPCALTEKEIGLLNSILATPDGKEPMHFDQDRFVNADGSIIYPVRGKRIYFEMSQ